MILDIFQSELTTLDSELLQLQALLEAKRQKQSLLQELQFETSAAIGTVALLKAKIGAVSGDAIASLKAAVLILFDDGDDGSVGGNQPHSPTPEPDDSEFELLCLNGDTGDALTTDDLTDAGEADETDIPDIKASLTYVQQIKNRCSACWVNAARWRFLRLNPKK